MKRFGIWTPFVAVLVLWVISSSLLDLLSIKGQLVRAAVLGGGMIALFLAAGYVRRSRKQQD
jgi:hypothetical protein